MLLTILLSTSASLFRRLRVKDKPAGLVTSLQTLWRDMATGSAFSLAGHFGKRTKTRIQQIEEISSRPWKGSESCEVETMRDLIPKNITLIPWPPPARDERAWVLRFGGDWL